MDSDMDEASDVEDPELELRKERDEKLAFVQVAKICSGSAVSQGTLTAPAWSLKISVRGLLVEPWVRAVNSLTFYRVFGASV
jgi:hypothetical protein